MSGDRLSILFICQHDLTGPSEKQMMGFAQGLAKRGHRAVLSFGNGSAAAASREGFTMYPGIELRDHRLAGRRLRGEDRAFARRFAPDVIHVVNSRVPTVVAAGDLAEATGAPLFVHFEDDEWRGWPAIPGESLYYRVGRRVRRLESLWRPYAWPHSTARTRRWVTRRAHALDALTPVLAEEVRAKLRRDCTPLLPVTPEVAPVAAEPFELPDSIAGMPFVLVTGTLYPFSLDDTVQALRAVAELQRRGHRLGYVHPGNVHPRMDADGLARQAGLQPGTWLFPGLLPYANMGPLLERAAIVMQPGRPTEFNRLRLPSKLQSYLASGTPTITFAAGFGELLADGEEAFLLRTGDASEVRDAILAILEDGALRERLTRGGPDAALRLFDPDRNTEALIAHYRRQLSARVPDADR